MLDLGNDLDLLNAAVIKAEHLKFVLHRCSSIDKCSIAQKTTLAEKGQSQPHYSDYFHAAVLSVFEDCVLLLSQRMSQRNKAHRPIREAGNRSIYLYRHENVVS